MKHHALVENSVDDGVCHVNLCPVWNKKVKINVLSVCSFSGDYIVFNNFSN